MPIHSRRHARERAARPRSRPLPAFLRAFFWDYDFKKLRWETDRDLIVGRILIWGTWDATTWLRRTAGDDVIRGWILLHEAKGLNKHQLSYWALVLNLPRRQV